MGFIKVKQNSSLILSALITTSLLSARVFIISRPSDWSLSWELTGWQADLLSSLVLTLSFGIFPVIHTICCDFVLISYDLRCALRCWIVRLNSTASGLNGPVRVVQVEYLEIFEEETTTLSGYILDYNVHPPSRVLPVNYGASSYLLV